MFSHAAKTQQQSSPCVSYLMGGSDKPCYDATTLNIPLNAQNPQTWQTRIQGVLEDVHLFLNVHTLQSCAAVTAASNTCSYTPLPLPTIVVMQ
jgi:hypothetical protein